MPERKRRALEASDPDLAVRIRRTPGGSTILRFEDFATKSSELIDWVWYVQAFDVRVVIGRPLEPFPHLSRREARLFEQHWPALVESVRHSPEQRLYLHAERFLGVPKLFYSVVWYALSRRVPVTIPRQSEQERYPVLPRPVFVAHWFPLERRVGPGRATAPTAT